MKENERKQTIDRLCLGFDECQSMSKKKIYLIKKLMKNLILKI